MARELLGKLGTSGWRPFIGWNLGLVLAALGWAIVFRFATGQMSGADFVALAGIVVPLCQFIYERSQDKRDERRNGPGGLVNPHALA